MGIFGRSMHSRSHRHRFTYFHQVLLDWLKRRFEGVASHKIEHGEFVLEDSRTKRRIDYSNNWHSAFHPGMQVTMDMLFRGRQLMGEYRNSCPSCGTECISSLDQRVVWYAEIPPSSPCLGIDCRFLVHRAGRSFFGSKSYRMAHRFRLTSTRQYPRIQRITYLDSLCGWKQARPKSNHGSRQRESR
jgi:hypothetical protein